jgi:hypothetical protein
VKGIKDYWGYLLFAVVITGWVAQAFPPLWLTLLSGVAGLFFLFRAPVWCGALTRNGQFCRKNAKGVLMGCSYRQHKWQKLKLAVVPPKWRELNRGLWVNPATSVATIAALASGLSALAAVVQLLVSNGA